MSKWIAASAALALILGAPLAVAEVGSSKLPISLSAVDKDGKPLPTYIVPKDADILRHDNAEQIMLGKRLLNETKRLLPENVGANMNCNSCHVAQGKMHFGAPYLNTVNSFPQFNPRAERVMTLEERVNGCFMRSMNGKPLAIDSKEMQAIVAYMQWLAQDVPHGGKAVELVNSGPIDMSLTPDPVRGQAIYAKQCATCHGVNGEGMMDGAGNVMFPPLWGEESFNIGAGLARLYKAAQFVKYNMPMGVGKTKPWGQGNVLSDQDAVDVAGYFTQMQRPDFPAKVNDWPSGKKPKDARY